MTELNTRPGRECLSTRSRRIATSAIHEIATLAIDHEAVDLALGSPEFAVPDQVKAAAARAIRDDLNQYTQPEGAESLRRAIAEKVVARTGVEVDPRSQVTVTCGATEALMNTLLAVLDHGDEVIFLEPYFENYVWLAEFCGAVPRIVSLHPPDWGLDEQELSRTFNARTKAIVLNTPANPTGKVLSRDELSSIAALCERWDALCISDEVYEYLVYDNNRHISIIQLENMRQRAVVVNSLSKTYTMTGWRLGYVIAPPELAAAIRRIHEINTCCAAAPLQAAAASALRLPDAYYELIRSDAEACRDRLMEMLGSAGFGCYRPQGGYFLMASIREFGFDDARDFVDFMIHEVGVAAVPGGVFCRAEGTANDLVRFCFCKSASTLDAAAVRLRRLGGMTLGVHSELASQGRRRRP